MDSKAESFRITHHDEYFDIALENYRMIEKLGKELDSIRQRYTASMPDNKVDLLVRKGDAIGRCALVIVVFCALSLEAYINYYGIRWLSANYFDKYLDKLDVISKWMVIPTIVTRSQLDPGAKPLQDLSWLITLRNRLVHYKSPSVTLEKLGEHLLWEEDAQKAIETVRSMVSALNQIDPRVEVDWLKTRPRRRLT